MNTDEHGWVAGSATTTFPDDNLANSDGSCQTGLNAAATGYKGRLTYVGNSNSNTRFGAFDSMGRVLASTQTTAGTAYGPFAYTYNLAGALATETYPSGTVLTNFYDTAGRVIQVQGTKGSVNTNFAQSVSYVPQGVSTLTLGNGLTETWTYGSTQKQPTALAAGGKLTLGWGYGPDSTNNGNIQSATIVTAPPTGTALNVTQAFSYDHVNRLIASSEGSTWSRNYGYDAWGNGWVTANSGLALNPFTPQAASNFDSNTPTTG